MKKVSWLILLQIAFMSSQNLIASEELRSLLVEITQEDEISDVCEAGDRYLDEIFERIQTELNKGAFRFLI